MNFGLQKHIEHFYPKAIFSEVIYLGTNNKKIVADYTNENAIAILYHYLYWVPDFAGGGLTNTFIDQYNNTLFYSLDPAGGATKTAAMCWSPLPLIRKGASILINNTNCSYFAISFQYLMQNLEHE